MFIGNEDRSFRAEVDPVHGGMIVQIYLDGKEMLHLDRAQLQTAPMAAGGIPILFPFSSKTKEDCYSLWRKNYRMPMHGLVKNDVFAVQEAEEHRVRLWLENSPSWKAQYFPFDFRLEVEYRIEGLCLEAIFSIQNCSEKPLPHYLGWHPFFKATDKKKTALYQDMQVHYDYVNNRDLPPCDLSDLSKTWDDVFHTPAKGGFEFVNTADGYRVICETDRDFEALVVCSWVQGSMCVEPWCGLPDSINTGRLLKWVAPGEKKDYCVRLLFESLS